MAVKALPELARAVLPPDEVHRGVHFDTSTADPLLVLHTVYLPLSLGWFSHLTITGAPMSPTARATIIRGAMAALYAPDRVDIDRLEQAGLPARWAHPPRSGRQLPGPWWE
jgi:hypothetical protein